MKKKAKKIIIICLVLGIIAGAGVYGVKRYLSYKQETSTIDVVPVSDLNWGYSEDSLTSSGYVSNDRVQSVYIEDKSVKEIMVAEGDEVKEGDTLVVYDTTEVELELEMKEMDLQKVNNDLAIAQKKLGELKNTTPTVLNTTASQSPQEPKPSPKPAEPEIVLQEQINKKDGNAYNYIDLTCTAYEGEGTIEKPYRFLCSANAYVTGEYLNRLVSKDEVAAFEIWSGNDVNEGSLTSCWTFNGMENKKVGTSTRWKVATQKQLKDEVISGGDTDDDDDTDDTDDADDWDDDSDDDSDEDEGMTAEELREAVVECTDEITSLTREKKTAEIEVDKLKKSMDKYTIKAKMDGVVKSVSDEDTATAEGTPLLQISGQKGFYVIGEIGELMLDQIEVGKIITVNNWETGQMYEAEITEISEYPNTNADEYGYGGGNSNVSSYPFKAYVKEDADVNNGDYVELSFTGQTVAAEQQGIIIDKAYVREENGLHYVYKVGKDQRIAKQYVKTGKILYGSAIEVKSGLTVDDYVAFPYGKNAKDGVKAKQTEE